MRTLTLNLTMMSSLMCGSIPLKAMNLMGNTEKISSNDFCEKPSDKRCIINNEKKLKDKMYTGTKPKKEHRKTDKNNKSIKNFFMF